MNILSNHKVPVKMWATNIEEGALQQIGNLANLPFIFHHLAIMPDCHQGYGMPIGGVLAADGVVIPNAVGVDIGCGMCALKTNLTIEDLTKENICKILGGSKEYKGGLRSSIPVGFNHHSKKQDEFFMPYNFERCIENGLVIASKEYSSALKQIGTLGGGNHFIEIQKDQENIIWIMIHSGSRNLGKQVADYYNTLAVELNAKWHVQVPKEQQLAFLPLDSQEGQLYLKEMQYCVDFALANRRLMIEQVKRCFYEVFPTVQFDPLINIAHNYASLENHFGRNVMVHRKGATLARKGTIGIIPGSQGTKSYIVEGLGNEESFMSCSHGAGRQMSRTAAIKNLSLQDEIKKMNDLGIFHGIRNAKDLDEAPGAYKNIDEVMENQKDLVKIVTELTPLAVIKG